MKFLDFLHKILTSYSELGSSTILKSAIISASIIVFLELISFFVIRIVDKNQKLKYRVLIISILKGIRVLLRTYIIYLFLIGIKSTEDAVYPVNLIYRGLELALLDIGVILAILKIIKVAKKRSSEQTEGNKIKISSEYRVNIVIILLVFSGYISQLKKEFSFELKAEIWISMIVVINSVLLMVVLFIAIEKILPRIQNYLNEHFASGLSGHFLSVVTRPLKILVITIFLLSIRPVLSEQASVVEIVSKLIEISISASILLIMFNLISFFITRLSKYSELETNSLDKTLIEMMRMIISVCFAVAFIFLTIRVITGKPLTTLLAGLGIGGFAVALAAQDTLKNFFGSIMIMTDKPFKVGERISTEGYDGVIESIGFRSTRLRTLTGNQVVIPNDRVAQASIENIGRRQSIRRLTNITVTYSTTPEKMEKALSIIRKILDNHEGMLPDLPPRVNFSEFNAESLNILVLYWYSPPDYWEYMRFSEEVNLKIMKEFAAEGIEFAFPTQTTYLEQEDGKSIKLDITGAGKNDIKLD